MTSELTERELIGSDIVCENIEAGDTIEVHWVHSSCTVKPGKDLGSCSSKTCANPDLRVEAQVFLVVNDPEAMDFADFAYGGTVVDGYHQARSIPHTTGAPVRFTGSTTGPKFSQETCSPLQVTWSVRPHCAKLDIASLARWCEGKPHEQSHGHGVRELVVAPELLSKID